MILQRVELDKLHEVIFDKKMDDRKNIKKYDHKIRKIIQKTINMIKIMTKCDKNVKFTKRENSRFIQNIFSLFVKLELGPSIIIR